MRKEESVCEIEEKSARYKRVKEETIFKVEKYMYEVEGGVCEEAKGKVYGEIQRKVCKEGRASV